MKMHDILKKVLCQEVHAATVLSLLVVADRHEASELKSTCVKVPFLSLSSIRSENQVHLCQVVSSS